MFAEAEGLHQTSDFSFPPICSTTATHSCEPLVSSVDFSYGHGGAEAKKHNQLCAGRFVVAQLLKQDPISLENLRPSPHPEILCF